MAGALDDYAPVLTLAQRGLEQWSEDHEMIKALGALLYRNGQFEQSVQQLEPICQPEQAGSTGKSSSAYSLFFLAMAQHQHEQIDAARATLARGVALAQTELSGESIAWNRKLTLELLQREAETLIGTVGTPAEQ